MSIDEKIKNHSPYVIVNKPVGLTPLQVVHQYKQQFCIDDNIKIGYSGRLDPMASGKLLLLFGNENKRKHIYEQLDKKYVFKILFGFSSDTYDLLGLITKYSMSFQSLQIRQLRQVLISFVGKVYLPLPLYSAYRINGKPLYYWAKKNNLSNISIPLKESKIYSCKLIQIYSISIKQLSTYIHSIIPCIKGDFRQKEITSRWKQILSLFNSNILLHLAKCEATVSAGTYIRSLVHEIGRKMNLFTLAYSIERTWINLDQLK